MRLPRDVSGADLVKVLKQLGYESTRQTGSHIRLTTRENGTHHITIPTTTRFASGPSHRYSTISLRIFASAATNCCCGSNSNAIHEKHRHPVNGVFMSAIHRM